VQRLAAQIAPGAPLLDLGGVMSLNMRLGPPSPESLVLRVHQPDECVSKARLLALQELRRRLAARGLRVPTAVPWCGEAVFRCGSRWAELEHYIPNERPKPSLEAFEWLYASMGTLHRALAAIDVPIPRPVFATFATPGSLHRWLPVTAAAVAHDAEAAGIVRRVQQCVRWLRRAWVAAAELPILLVHGDVRLSNVRRGAGATRTSSETVYFDFGFLAMRPRVHDLAYSLANMVWALDHLDAPERFPWGHVPRLIDAYQAAAGWRLSAAERRALLPYTAAVPLYYAALDGFTEDPAGKLRTRVPFLRLSEWLLERLDSPWS
jgi:Ser/Thr protein kinase RdoA (MazF antagonist)